MAISGTLCSLLPSPAWAEGTVVSLCVCVCVCVLPQNLHLNSFILKSKQATGLKFGILREKVVLYKAGKFLQAGRIYQVHKF